MLHHTRISIGSDDVTMLRLQIFFFYTLRLRHTYFKIALYFWNYMKEVKFNLWTKFRIC